MEKEIIEANDFNKISEIVQILTSMDDSDTKSIMLQSVYFGMKSIERISSSDKKFDLSTPEGQIEFIEEVFGIKLSPSDSCCDSGNSEVSISPDNVDMDLVNLLSGSDESCNKSLTDSYNEFTEKVTELNKSIKE